MKAHLNTVALDHTSTTQQKHMAVMQTTSDYAERSCMQLPNRFISLVISYVYYMIMTYLHKFSSISPYTYILVNRLHSTQTRDIERFITACCILNLT